MPAIRNYGPTLVLLVTVVTVMLLGPNVVRQIAAAQRDSRLTLIQNELVQSNFLAELSDAFTKVAEVVEPSVAHIDILNSRNWQMGNGSGWVIDSEGHVITNSHVVGDADKIMVRFRDGSRFEAEVVGQDAKTDIAVLKIDAPDLRAASIATKPVKKGEIVFAFGSPLDFDFSMSQGLVSAVGRETGALRHLSGYESFIQTDAAINQGNSGGPLVNIYGQIVGMNTAIASVSERRDQAGFLGVGFAIPVDLVVNVAQQIIINGEVQRGFLGVFIQDISDLDRRLLSYDGDGVLVTGMTADSPARVAGLQPDDIIVSVDGEATPTTSKLRLVVSSHPPDTTIKVEAIRNGEPITFDVTLARLNERQMIARGPQRDALADLDRRNQSLGQSIPRLQQLGLGRVMEMTPDIAARLGWDEVEGVVVLRAAPFSLASAMGLTSGMIITQVGDTPITSADDLVSAMTEAVESFETTQEFVTLQTKDWSEDDEAYLVRELQLEMPEGFEQP